MYCRNTFCTVRFSTWPNFLVLFFSFFFFCLLADKSKKKQSEKDAVHKMLQTALQQTKLLWFGPPSRVSWALIFLHLLLKSLINIKNKKSALPPPGWCCLFHVNIFFRLRTMMAVQWQAVWRCVSPSRYCCRGNRTHSWLRALPPAKHWSTLCHVILNISGEITFV